MAGVVVLAAFATWPILRVFSAGGAILAAGEIAALWLDRRGPIVALFLGQPAYLVRLWIWSAAIGLVYETANHVFPVWVWGLLETHSLPTTELLIVGFGYVVLFHPWYSVGRSFSKGLNRVEKLFDDEDCLNSIHTYNDKERPRIKRPNVDLANSFKRVL